MDEYSKKRLTLLAIVTATALTVIGIVVLVIGLTRGSDSLTRIGAPMMVIGVVLWVWLFLRHIPDSHRRDTGEHGGDTPGDGA